jgi:hypothetical protein
MLVLVVGRLALELPNTPFNQPDKLEPDRTAAKAKGADAVNGPAVVSVPEFETTTIPALFTPSQKFPDEAATEALPTEGGKMPTAKTVKSEVVVKTGPVNRIEPASAIPYDDAVML